MKLVIDIDENILNDAKNGHVRLGEIADAVLNGTVLPGEHGDLIDSHDLETRKFIGVEEHKTLKTDDELSAYQSGWNTAVDEIIKYAPRVIPADKCGRLI